MSVSARGTGDLGIKMALSHMMDFTTALLQVLPFSALLQERLCSQGTEGANVRHVSTGPLKRPLRFLILTSSGQTSGWVGANEMFIVAAIHAAFNLRCCEPGILCLSSYC